MSFGKQHDPSNMASLQNTCPHHLDWGRPTGSVKKSNSATRPTKMRKGSSKSYSSNSHCCSTDEAVNDFFLQLHYYSPININDLESELKSSLSKLTAQKPIAKSSKRTLIESSNTLKSGKCPLMMENSHAPYVQK